MQFGTGTALFGRDAKANVVQALEGGFNHIDMAQMYRNEESVGVALRDILGDKADLGDQRVGAKRQSIVRVTREDIWVSTQYGGVGDAVTALDASLKKVCNDFDV